MSAASEWCLGCGRARRSGEWGCPSCGADVYADHVPPGVVPRGSTGAVELRGVLGRLLAPVPPAVVAIHGRRGSGKTTLALQSLARPYIASSEMEPGLVVRYLERLRVQHAGIGAPRLVEDDLGRRIELGEPARRAVELVLDSATACPDEVLAVGAAREWARAATGIALVIFQHTKAGEARGSAQALHACDAEVLVEQLDGDRIVTVLKNRFGDTSSISFDVTAEGATGPARDRYYSIEGEAGNYRLVPFPSPRSGPYAAYWRWAETELERDADDVGPVQLPPAPAAVAALHSPLYRPPWQEPPDVAERAAFARRHGVPYWSPRTRAEVT